ncbi:ParB/RepB/Spo0J family partition protein [Paenirhodobacter enshiensis]|uniref:ParB/RepB/Spo0J family partition protein n=1 Tax=Paenirhodobacter enshiensis TaxID=1105367 RepID=UPI0035AF0285
MKTPTLLQINRVPVADVIERDRLRPVRDAGVQSLIASISETGVMKDAIHVRKKKDGLYLIAGSHRIEAARRLGWTEIEAKVWTDVTDDWARLMEIDDNLAGAEMDALDTAVFLATRKAVYERLHPETKQATGAALVAKRWAPDTSDIVSFVSATSEKFGVSKRHIERMVAAGVRLDPEEVSRLRAAPKPVTLKDLTEIGKIDRPTERYDVVRLLSQGDAKSAADARRSLNPAAPAPVKDPVEEGFTALMTVWHRVPMAARNRFVDAVGVDLARMLGMRISAELPDGTGVDLVKGIAAE